MGRTLTRGQLAAQTGVPVERLDWLTRLGILSPDGPDSFSAGDSFKITTVEALLGSGFTAGQIEQAVTEGILNLDYLDQYYLEPSLRSARSFAAFAESLPSGGAVLPAMFEVLGFPPPGPGSPVSTGEEEIFTDFLRGWGVAEDQEVLIRAARLIGEGTRLAAQGWFDLFNEQVTAEAVARLVRRDPGAEEHALALRQAGALLAQLAPRMMVWLAQRYLEQSMTSRTIEQFEQFMAARGLLPRPRAGPPPSVVFVDLSGYTSFTRQVGDDAAVRSAWWLRERAEAAARTSGGRLVKLLGDGAMLHFGDPRSGVLAALDLVDTARDGPGLDAHAGVHAGAVIERDRDLFGMTVNVASRIAGQAGPGEVVVSEGVAQSVEGDGLRFEKIGDVLLKGLAGALPLFRALPHPQRRPDG